MALQYSTAVRNAKLDAVESAIGTAPIMRLYSGSAPANPAAAATGTLLAEITMPSDWMAAAASGSKAMSGSWQDLSADATGTPGYFRIWNSAGSTCHVQGSAGTSGTDMILSTGSLTAGQSFSVTGFTIQDNNA